MFSGFPPTAKVNFPAKICIVERVIHEPLWLICDGRSKEEHNVISVEREVYHRRDDVIERVQYENEQDSYTKVLRNTIVWEIVLVVGFLYGGTDGLNK